MGIDKKKIFCKTFFIMRLFSTIIIISFAFLFPFVSFSQQPPQGKPEVVRKTILDFRDELKLTEDQVKSIKKIIDEFETKNRPLLEKLIALDKELKELLEKEGDLGEIKKKIKEIYSLRAEMVINEIEAGRKIDKVLNKEQKEKWKQIRRGNIKKEGG